MILAVIIKCNIMYKDSLYYKRSPLGLVEIIQFRIQQYLQHEHYALWEVIEFGDSYKVPTNTDPDNAITRKDDEQSGRTVTITIEDMHRKKNDVKARTNLLLSLPDENQLRFSKFKIAKELWAAILKTFGGNEATKKRKKNLLKQQYGNFKAEGLETMDVEVEKDDLNQKFLTSLGPEWLMHTIVWRNRNDLDTMSLDDLYNHLKVYEAEVQKKSNLNSQDMAFISSSKNSSNKDGNTACVTTASTAFPTGSVNVVTISHDTVSAYIASQSNGSQIKFEDINQIDEDDMEEMDIKWNMALLSMRADKFWKRTGKKIIIQGSDERGRKESYRQGSKAEEKTSKALMAIDGVGWDWSYMSNEGEDHALVADREAPTEFTLMANTESKVFDNSLCSNEYKELEELKLEKDGLDGKLARLLKASKNIDHLIKSQRSDQVKEGVGYNAVPPPAADLYLSSKKDLSWTGLPEFVDDTVTDYSRPSPTVASTSAEGQNTDSFTFEDVASPNPPKPFVKPHGPSMNPIRPNMNGARPNRSFSIQAPSYETKPFLKSSAVKTQYRALWVPTVNRNNPPVSRKFSTGRRNFPTVTRSKDENSDILN
nr:hypothetical protein [Tanacetum cinerariifolium]